VKALTAASQKICIVDDDKAVRHSMRVLLELHGFKVEEYAGAREFLDRMRPGDTGCLLLDLYMPEMDGADLLNALERQGIALPVIVLTGRPESPRARRALKAGARVVLNKPVPEGLLLDWIHTAMESALPSDSLASDKHALVAGNPAFSGTRLHTIP
jgi:two-component system response regulator FixJ